MASINRVVLVGNLTKDPELRHTPSGTAVCNLRLAVNTRRKDETGQWVDKPNYFDITVWGNQGERCAQYLAKGRPVGVDGRLEWREWETPEGNKRQAVEVVADTVQFLGGRGDGDGAAAATSPPTRPRRPPATFPRPRPTTTSRSRRPRDGCEDATPQAAGPRDDRGSPQELPLLQGQGGRGGLQERQPAPALRLGEGQDPQPPHHRAPAAATSARSPSAVKRAREMALLPYVQGS